MQISVALFLFFTFGTQQSEPFNYSVTTEFVYWVNSVKSRVSRALKLSLTEIILSGETEDSVWFYLQESIERINLSGHVRLWWEKVENERSEEQNLGVSCLGE